jgi:hypothetical protein
MKEKKKKKKFVRFETDFGQLVVLLCFIWLCVLVLHIDHGFWTVSFFTFFFPFLRSADKD